MKTNLEGLVPEMTNEDYHKTAALSSSGLKELDRSPAHYQAYLKRDMAPSEAMKLGSGVHSLFLEPTLFPKLYARRPDGIKLNTNAGKEAFAKFQADNPGKTILEGDAYDSLDGMLNSILSHKTALSLLSGGRAEQSIFWTDQATGVQCKCRPDFLRDDGIVVDLKTTGKGADMRSFQRALVDNKYHLQSAHYLEGVSQVLKEPVDTFVHLVIETTAPFAIGIYTLDDATLSFARKRIDELLAIYVECQRKNEWPSYSDQIQDVSLPSWAWAS